jgi:hypothetical protein
MTTPGKQMLSDVSRLEQEHAHERNTVDHIRALLIRADARRAQEPDNVRRWNRVLDNLETALDEAKGRLERCETRLNQARQAECESTSLADGDAPSSLAEVDSRPAPFLPAQPGNAEASAAAQFLLQAPLDTVENAPLEQVALARNYLSWRSRTGHANGDEKRLAGRIELAIQGRTPGASSTVRERRQQFILRAAVDKIVAGRVDSMTFRELELVVSSYTVLVQRPERTVSEERLVWILAKAAGEVERLVADLPAKAP